MSTFPDPSIQAALDWAHDVLGPVRLLHDASREHAGERAGALHLATPAGECYLKLHRDPAHWANEVFAYTAWAPAFGDYAPRLLAVRDTPPLAIAISALPGRILDETHLTPHLEQAAWRAAGAALAHLHRLPAGDFFGACRPDGQPADLPVLDACAYLAAELADLEARAAQAGFFGPAERRLAQTARDLLPAFASVRPCACHRDYCPANWLVTPDGRWRGVIDFEFSGWDAPSADFARLPNWEWVNRPDLTTAFTEGYRQTLTPPNDEQIHFSQALYALGAIVWGEENDYHIFAAEGRAAVKSLLERR